MIHKSHITFVATAHHEVSSHRPFIDSMLAQTDEMWDAIVYHNGPYAPNVWDFKCDGLKDQPVYKHSPTDTGDWGTANRQRAIDECTTNYIIQTSIQDYWLPQAVATINKLITDHKPDLILWNSINHVVGPCLVLDSKLEWSKVDWGNFAIRSDIAKYIGIRHGDKYTADWLFINDVLTSGLLDMTKVIKTNAILTIHN